MAIKLFKKAALKKWVDSLIAGGRVFGVQAKGERFAFGPLEKAADLRLDYDVTILPPKKYLQPQTEDLVKFSKGGGYESVIDSEPFVLLGVHPYDMAAINQMDAIFLKDGEVDTHYKARREAATIVACDVESPSENVFAGCMGTAVVDKGYDVLVTAVDGGYVVETASPRGEKLLAAAGEVPDASKKDMKKRKAVQEKNRKRLRKHELKGEPLGLPCLLGKSENHPVWEEKARLCYSCGSCNLVCPTCYCFDVQDDTDWTLESGRRYRVWDACLLADFAAVAGGHNFRKERAARFRHRYYRKGKYIPEKIGEIACVGCGRCITACTAKIANPVEVYNRLTEGC
ncbi:MAG: 4Fe-4S dicluster domain-containing protein [Planctomycetes bacterium]|nr:4Fe-4S dicluster domain-containing protein [Planctomycetota bacterium]